MISTFTPRLARIRIHPIKSLDPVEISFARIGPSGGLEHDRAWALFSADGGCIRAKRAPGLHQIRAVFSNNLASATLSVPHDRRKLPAVTLDFPGDTGAASAWFSEIFDQPVTVRHDANGFPDDTVASGPTIISTATLQTVASWFPELSTDEMRLRFRTTLEIDGAAAFWEDRLSSADARGMLRFHIGDVAFEGSYPCERCPVPARQAETGEVTAGFQKHFSTMREACLPAWAPRERFDHFYRLATNTRVASGESGKILRVGDELSLSTTGIL